MSRRSMITRFIGFILLFVGLIALSINKYDLGWNNWATISAVADGFIHPRTIMPGPIKVAPGSDAGTTVVIRADDAKSSWYKYQFPVIQRLGLPCELYVVTSLVGQRGFMTWDQILEVQRWGCVIEDHTHKHTFLTKLTNEELIEEVVESRRILEEKVGRKPMVIASPMGDYNSRVLQVIREAGYTAHVAAYGAEEDDGPINEPKEGRFNAFDLAGFDVKNTHSAKFVCDAVKKAQKKDQLLVLVYHFAQERGKPAESKNPFKTSKSLQDIGKEFPEELHVYVDVFEEMMACIAQERDAGRIRVDTIVEAFTYYQERHKRQKPEEKTIPVASQPAITLAKYQPSELVRWAMLPIQHKPAVSTTSDGSSVAVPLPHRRVEKSISSPVKKATERKRDVKSSRGQPKKGSSPVHQSAALRKIRSEPMDIDGRNKSSKTRRKK